MRTFLTGAGGQIGADLLPRLIERGDEVTVFDIVPKPPTCPERVAWIRGDITVAAELNEAIRDARPERIFHLAAILSASGERMPHRAWHVNMGGTYNLFEAARLFDVKQVFFTSTIAVFGPGLKSPVGDDVPLRPTTMYGVTKVAGERLGEYYRDTFGIDFRGVRFPGLISATEPGGGTSDYALYMYVDGLRKGHYECFVGPESRIPFMYMPDAVRAMLELSDAPRGPLKRSIYNIAAMHPTAEAFAEAVRQRVEGVSITFRVDPKRQAILDSWPDALDDSNARSEWGWKPTYDLEGMSDDLVASLAPKAPAALCPDE